MPAAVWSTDTRLNGGGYSEGHILPVGTPHRPKSSGDFGGRFEAGTSLWGGAPEKCVETSAKLTNKQTD